MSFERGRPARLLAAIALGATTLGLAACPGSLDHPEDFNGVPADILAPRCATANCHDAKFKAGFLDLTPDADLRARLVDVPAKGPGCNGKLVDSAHPEQSLLYTKCTASPPCGTEMPQTGQSLDQDELDAMLAWVSGLEK
jgi:hypothetical protein